MKYVLIFAAIFLAAIGIGYITTEKKAEPPDFPPLVVDLEDVIPEEPDEETLIKNISPNGESPQATEKNSQPIPETEPPAPISSKSDPIEEAVPFTKINTTARAALVNILCTTVRGGVLQTTTGSGVIIDEKGVILTNAHLAQYFLLTDSRLYDSVDCVIRTGSPAQNAYRGILLYLPPAWIAENKASIAREHPTGTGKDDFAFILIQEHVRADGELPARFPHVAIDPTESRFAKGAPVLAASYPAEFLSTAIIQKDFYAASTLAAIGEIYTFASTTIDVISVGGSLAAQQGSSGGAVMGGHNKLIGLITLSTSGETTAERDLRAITLAHIERSMVEKVEQSIQTFLSGNLAANAEAFNADIVPTLTASLEAVLEGGN